MNSTAKELELISLAGSHIFSNWLFDVSPDWQWNAPHLTHIRKHLARITDGRCKRLMIFLPPRHGKSEMTTVRYSAWRLEQDPSQRVIVGAYSQTLADKFSRKIRKIAESRSVPIDPRRTAVDDWETDDGGGIRAAGVGAGVTGMGGNLIVIDDPIKNRQEANSIVYRDKVWSWYTDDLYTRLEPGGAIIMIMTRWHEDDLAGRILESDDAPNWTVINLPAIAELDDALNRSPGEPLWPDRYDAAGLAAIKQAIGSRAFTALYQQRPVEQEGGMFKRSWFTVTAVLPEMTAMIRYWDFAATAGDGDYTAGLKMGLGVDGKIYILDLVHGQWSTSERNKIVRQAAESDGDIYQIFEREGGSSGKDAATYLISQMMGFRVRGVQSTGSKVFRAEPFADQCEAGNVYLARAAWNGRFLDELCMFPNGAHDDIVDGCSGAFNNLGYNYDSGVMVDDDVAEISPY